MDTATGFQVKRKYGESQIFVDGVRVGEAFKYTRGSGFGLRLYGIYWRDGMPNRKGGQSTAAFKRLREAIQAARTHLEAQK